MNVEWLEVAYHALYKALEEKIPLQDCEWGIRNMIVQGFSHAQEGKRGPRPSLADVAKESQGSPPGRKLLKHIADQLTSVLTKPDKELINPDTNKEYSRREVRIVRDVLDFVLARNDLRTPLHALLEDKP